MASNRVCLSLGYYFTFSLENKQQQKNNNTVHLNDSILLKTNLCVASSACTWGKKHGIKTRR